MFVISKTTSNDKFLKAS